MIRLIWLELNITNNNGKRFRNVLKTLRIDVDYL